MKIKLTCTGDASNGTIPATVINTLANIADVDLRGKKLYEAKAYPGGTAPTDATDVTITDEDGIDLLGGRGADLVDATSKTYIAVGPASTYQPALITGNMTLNISNQAVHSAVFYIILTIVG
jgi:hypothetical protein